MHTRITHPIERSVYHCVSRSTQQEFYFQRKEQDIFRKMMWRVAEFCGVTLLTYAVMNNHFHILCSVPKKDDADAALTWDVFFPRYEALYVNRQYSQRNNLPRPHFC